MEILPTVSMNNDQSLGMNFSGDSAEQTWKIPKNIKLGNLIYSTVLYFSQCFHYSRTWSPYGESWSARLWKEVKQWLSAGGTVAISQDGPSKTQTEFVELHRW